MAAPAAATRLAHCTLLLVLFAGAFADEMVVEDESADDSAGGTARLGQELGYTRRGA